jgi:hypothetical protein
VNSSRARPTFSVLRGAGTRLQHEHFSSDGDEIVAAVANSTGGFTNVLCALKALLEHDVELNVVLDHTPPDDAGL